MAFSLWAMLCLGLFASCNTTKYLEKEGIVLVDKNRVEIVSEEKIPNQGNLSYNLSTYHKQKPNQKFLGLFRTRLWFHDKNNDPADTSKWNNFARRFIAEKPVIFQEKLTKGTAEAMKNYMKHKGYLNAEVEYEVQVDSTKRLARNYYKVYPNPRYHYDSIFFKSKDEYIHKVLQDTRADSHLQPGQPIDADSYNKEVSRLVRLFRNMGYFHLSRNHISSLDADSSNYKVKATLTVLLPQDGRPHQIYTIGKVQVYPNYLPEYRDWYKAETEADGVTYMSIGNPGIKYRTLSRNIKLRAGDTYQQSHEEATNKRLGSLGLYKFIAISPDTIGNVVDFHIYLPARKRQEIGWDVEFNTANNTTLQNTSIGTALRLNYGNKNLMGGAEVFSANLQGGVEVALRDPNRVFNSVDISAGTQLKIPKFVDYTGFYILQRKLGILSQRAYEKLKETANTRISLGYNYLNLVDFYDYHSLDATFGYSIRPNERWRIEFVQTGITYFNPNTRPAFNQILEGNEFLSRSFGRQLFTGALARNVQASHRPKVSKNNLALTTRMSGEVSGLEIFTLNQIFAPNNEWQLFDTVQYSSFLKLESEHTGLKTINRKRSLAYRFSAGVAFPYGKSSEVVPYVKQFHVGGPNSIRAWSIRELGPGGYRDEVAADPSNTSPFYQTGDIKMETNVEYRFDVFWVFEAAVFLDVGNVWTLEKDPNRPGSQIGTDFWRQFAVGTGLGFRLDFDYFIFRLDLGYPLRNNYPDAHGKYWRFQTNEETGLNQLNFNLAIGYPFS